MQRRNSFDIGEESVFINIYSQTQSGEILNELKEACKGSFVAEKNIYDVDEKVFDEQAFTKALLGRNKLEYDSKKDFPYNPNDIVIFNNTLITYSINNQVVGYFSILSFYQKTMRAMLLI